MLGDSALILDDKGHPLPTNAYFAEQHGRVAAQNIYAIMRGGETKKSYSNISLINLAPLLLFLSDQTLPYQG